MDITQRIEMFMKSFDACDIDDADYGIDWSDDDIDTGTVLFDNENDRYYRIVYNHDILESIVEVKPYNIIATRYRSIT